MDGMLILFLPGKRAKFFRKARRRRKFFPPFCFSSPIGNYCGGLILFGPFIRFLPKRACLRAMQRRPSHFKGRMLFEGKKNLPYAE
nr:hypothetical protein [Bacillaceae bacterium]